MTQVAKGPIIREPRIDMILRGEKTWEMRSSSTAFRGWFGLIRQGSGTVVGAAELVDVGERLSAAALLKTIDRHRIPAQSIRAGDVSKWNIPWRLGRFVKLWRPVPYHHKPGAVRWVDFDPEVVRAIAKEMATFESSA